MNHKLPGSASADGAGEVVTLLGIAAVVLRRRRLIMGLGVAGAIVGLVAALVVPRRYASDATFVSQGPDASMSGIALAASQFGLRLPNNSQTWGTPIYAELLESRTLLEPVALDTIVVREEQSRRMAVMDLLNVHDEHPGRRVEKTIRALRRLVSATEDKKLNAVRLRVSTRWPSVSHAIAQSLVHGVDQFNLEVRQSQGSAERRFVERQTLEAEQTLRAAEERLNAFNQRNLSIGNSSQLALQRQRLERDVTMLQSAYTALVQSRDEARIREVRDTPVITVLEAPRLPATGEPRRTPLKTVLGGLIGGMLGVMIALLAHGLQSARGAPTPEAREFFAVMEEAKPRFLARSTR